MAPRKILSPSSELLAQRLGLRRSGNRFVGACPACGYRDSLNVSDGSDRPLIYCHACQDVDAVVGAICQRGFWGEGRKADRSKLPAPGLQLTRTGLRARELWFQASTAGGTLVETYLRSRGIITPPPSTLRFLPQAIYSPTGARFPTMIAAVTIWPERKPCAVHRTFLASDGQGKAPVDTPKMSLGPCRRGAVRLAEATEQLMVGEGIETVLAAMQATGRPAWAALSTGGLRVLDLPPHVKEVIILGDPDLPGEQAAQFAAARWVRERRRVRIARPPRVRISTICFSTALA